MNAYLVLFHDIPWGCTMRTIVGPDSKEDCMEFCSEKFGCQFDNPSRRDYAEITDECSVMYDKYTYVEYSFEE